MKQLFNLLPFLLLTGVCSAQFINDGGNVTIKPGAVLFVETDFVNNTVGPSTGTVTVEGTLEVQGNLTNNADMTTAVGSTIIFSGATNSDFTSGGTVVENLKMDKDDATNGTVTLIDDLSVKTNIDFDPSTNGNKLVLGAQDLLLTDQATTITNPSANDYIVADAAGMIQKETNADGNFLFPIGDAVDYSPIDVNYTSGNATYTAANLRVNLDDVAHPNVPADADDFIERYWNVNETGIGSYSATLTGTYAASDVIGGSPGDVMGASQADGATGMNVADWTFTGSDNAANEVVGTVSTSSTDFTGFNFFGKANLKVFLGGANPLGGVSMTSTLNTLNLIPLSSPYSTSPWNAPAETASAIPANATDWILVEARDQITPSTVLSKTSAFLLNDGTIVDKSGNQLYLKDSDPSSIIAISHRNHLSVRTDIGLDLVNSSLFDFTDDLTNVYTNGGISNDPMKLGSSGAYVLWGGNANSNTNVRYLGPANDNSRILIKLGGVAGSVLTSQYSPEDLNMNGNVRYLGPANDNSVLLQVLGGAAGTVINQHN